jgi:hypothetical protein
MATIGAVVTRRWVLTTVMLDHFNAAYADFTNKFGPDLPLRKALLKLLRTNP